MATNRIHSPSMIAVLALHKKYLLETKWKRSVYNAGGQKKNAGVPFIRDW